MTATGDRIRFYDLHWADLTKTLPGRLNAFLGTFRIIFEAHHFIDALLPRETRGAARLLRTLLLWAASILRGPIVGLSTFLVVIGLAFYVGWPYLSVILGEDRQGIGVMWFVVALLGATFAIAAMVFRYRGHSRETEWNDVLVTIIYGSVFVGVYILYNVYPLWKSEVGVTTTTFRRCDSIEFIYAVIQIFRWCLLLLLAIPLAAWLFLSSLFKRTAVRPNAGMAALSVVVLQSALWLALISAFAIPLIKQASLHQELAKLRQQSNVIETCDLEGLYISAAGTFVLLAIVALFGLLTYLARAILSRLQFVDLEWRAALTPRLLLGAGVTMAVLIGLVIQIGFFIVSLGDALQELSRGVTSALF